MIMDTQKILADNAAWREALNVGHTPGPWTLDTNVPPANDLRIWAERSEEFASRHPHDGSQLIASVTISKPWWDGFKCLPENDVPPALRAEQIANARLIAAAPELLDALKAIDAATKNPAFMDLFNFLEDDSALEKALDLGLAAIAKASGK